MVSTGAMGGGDETVGRMTEVDLDAGVTPSFAIDDNADHAVVDEAPPAYDHDSDDVDEDGTNVGVDYDAMMKASSSDHDGGLEETERVKEGNTATSVNWDPLRSVINWYWEGVDAVADVVTGTFSKRINYGVRLARGEETGYAPETCKVCLAVKTQCACVVEVKEAAPSRGWFRGWFSRAAPSEEVDTAPSQEVNTTSG